MTASLRIQSSKADSNTWFIRGTPRSDVFRKRATKPLLNQKEHQKHLIDSYRNILPGLRRKRTGLLLSGPKSSFQMKVILHLIWKSGSHSLEEERRGTESMLFEVQCEVSTVSDDLGCHVICWCWSSVFSEVHSQRSHLPGNFSALHVSFC